jgi:hypothetical protein
LNERIRLAREAADILQNPSISSLVNALELVANQISLCENQVFMPLSVRDTKKKLDRLAKIAIEIADIFSDPLFCDEFSNITRGPGEKCQITRLQHLAEAAERQIENSASKRNTDVTRDSLGTPRSVKDVRKMLNKLRDNATEMAAILSEPLFCGMFRNALSGPGTSSEKSQITPRRLRDLPEAAGWLKEVLSSQQGPNVVMDHLGMARGRPFCAIAVVRLWEIYRGHPPDNETPDAQRLCALLWEAGEQPITPEAEKGITDRNSAWSRFIAGARNATKGGQPTDPAWWARGRTNAILVQAGVLPDRNE